MPTPNPTTKAKKSSWLTVLCTKRGIKPPRATHRQLMQAAVLKLILVKS